jgi:glycosyltransferase involved in cell wall biosynthesis
MKICFLCSEYPPGPHGGIGTLIQTFARGLAASGHSVRVIGTYPKSYPAPDYEEDHGVAVWRYRDSGKRLGWLASSYRLFQTVARWSQRGEIDLIEVPDYGAPAAGWPRLRIPVIARLSGSISYFAAEMGKSPKWTTYQLERWSLNRADFWCSESKYIAEKTKALFRLKSESSATIYNPVELPTLAANQERIPNRVVFAGTLTRKKGILSLIDAWPTVNAANPKAELHVWGKDTKTETGESMLELLKKRLPASVAKSVQFHGHVSLDALVEEFKRTSIVVLPSYAEGFALTPLHAMAAGCATVYTTRGSGPEVIECGANGLLIDPDRPDEIARAISSLLQDPSLTARLGRAGRQTVETHFSLESIQSKNVSLYERCLEAFHNKKETDYAHKLSGVRTAAN